MGVKQEKPEPSDIDETSNTPPRDENLPAPLAQYQLQTDLFVNFSATIDETRNVEFEEAHSNRVKTSLPTKPVGKSLSTEPPVPPDAVKP